MTAGLVGTRLGKYEVCEEIGQGGMSVVYRATDRQLERDVAIKVMHSFLAEQDEARERFHREAVAVARLRHPHIIEIYDYSGEDADTAYIVTELVDGEPLSDRLQNGNVQPPEAALVLARPIADALAHAHEHGIIHRDLKPENILVGRTGCLKLTDFGIARMLDSHTLTMTGTLLGSPAYMAPEYIEGYATDERADIFSFGSMLYQFAVGRLPFEGSTPHALLKKIATCDFPAPDRVNPQVHGRIVRLLNKCLARLPEQRFTTAAEMLAEIDAELDRLGIDHRADLPRLLDDGDAYGEQLRTVLATRYVDLGKASLRCGRTGAALEDFDRVLSLDPSNAEVRRILDRLARRAFAWRALRAVALGLVGGLLVTLVVGSGISLWNEMTRRAIAEAALAKLRNTPPPVEPNEPTQRNLTVIVRGTGDLFVDSELAISGASGDEALLLKPGEYELRLVGAEREAIQPIIVPENGAIAPVRLDVYVAPRRPRPPPLEKRVVEFNAPRWVNVFVDGKPVESLKGVFGRFKHELTYGNHTLRFENDLGNPLEMEIEVGAESPPSRITVMLAPKPAKLFVKGAPDRAVVQIANGKPHMLTDVTRDDPILVPLELGPDEASREYEVVIRSADGKEEYRNRVEFHPNEKKILEVQLRPL
ncbi:MAG: protein kinase [Myxococcota bacterium]